MDTGPFERHIAACNNLPSTAGLVPFLVAGAQAGWVGPGLARALAGFPDAFRVDAAGATLTPADTAGRTAALGHVVRALAGQEQIRLRREAFDIRATPEGPALAAIDRGAVPPFGVISQGVHVNGIVRRADGVHLWVGFRARDKAVAPGKLDHLVAGGIPAGLSAEATLAKEAAEEASLPPGLAATARRVGRVSYVMRTAEGIRRDVLHCFDLDLPADLVPRPGDDEVERFELWPIARVVDAVRDTDAVKFNVNLVLIDLFLREGLIDPASPGGRRLRAGLDRGV